MIAVVPLLNVCASTWVSCLGTNGPQAVTEWIETVYNRRRRHSSLGQISPVTFEHNITTAAHQAA